MIGGGRGAFIGGVHRIAAAMDGQAELVAGAFSSDPKRSKASGSDLYLDPSRVYGSYAEMAEAESLMPGRQTSGLRRHRDAQPPALWPRAPFP